MTDAVAAALSEVCRRVVVVGDAEALPGRTRIADLRPQHGPLGGIEALLASDIDSRYLVCPCDMPMITATLLRRLTEPSDAAAVVFHVADAERFLPLPARLGVEALEGARRQLDEGRRAVHAFIESIAHDEVAVGASEAPVLMNINTPDELAMLTVHPPIRSSAHPPG